MSIEAGAQVSDGEAVYTVLARHGNRLLIRDSEGSRWIVGTRRFAPFGPWRSL